MKKTRDELLQNAAAAARNAIAASAVAKKGKKNETITAGR
jgi:hypothetical protein